MSKQREIKFRAWDEKTEEMLEVSEAIFINGEIADYRAVGDHSIAAWRGGDVAMQYTGLKDKNGVEIYEGDILEYVSPEPCEDDAREIYIVEWKLFGFEATWHHPHKPNFTSDGHLSLRGADEDMKIIGNIYENPELLETK